jgi:thioredoxin-related protein
MKIVHLTAATLAIAGFAIASQAQEAAAPAAPVAAKPEAKAELWTSDFAAAKAQAAKDGKDMLVDFTGSDWCGWCIKLKKEVFSTPEFEAAAPKKFVLVELDYPRDQTKLSAETKEQNAKLQKEFGIRGFPTIMLLDGQGRPFAQTGYQQGGPAAYLKHLDELQAVREKRDAAWKKAEAATGLDKAKALAEGLAAMDEELVIKYYLAIVEEIKTLDPQDATGMVKKFAFKAKLADLQAQAEAVRRNGGDKVAGFKLVDDFIAENKLTGNAAQDVQLMKVMFFSARSPADADAVAKLMEEIIAIDPATAAAKKAGSIKAQAATIKKALEEAAKKAAAPAGEAGK